MTFTDVWQITAPDAPLRRARIERRALRPDDVAVDILFSGVCRTDAHAHAQGSPDPLVPGHEFTTRVAAIGTDVTRFAVGDLVAVGNIVDSCGECDMCAAGQENFCRDFPTLTYGGADRVDGSTTQGGFSRSYVVRETFVYPLPDGLDPAGAAPLMCAGVTVWEPLVSLGVREGTRLAVVGLGGLGHLAVKFAVALGAEVTVISRGDKAVDARRMGAARYVRSDDLDALAAERARFDAVLDLIPVEHDLAPYLDTLTMDGTLALVGHLGHVELEAMSLLVGRKRLMSAGSGGRPATADMLAFAAEHGIVADIELFPFDETPAALAHVAADRARYRAVLDLTV